MQNKIDKKYIRNFSIIAHIDHGKSTLADRLIEHCNDIEKDKLAPQVLDSMDIERERGITIKSQTVKLMYKARDNNTYMLNLIDTPGHVDFAYEVSRALSSCEGSLLVVDATQGVESQTLANLYQAIENDHEIITVLNKIDLPASEPERVKEQIENIIGLDTKDAVLISAKNAIGIEDVLEAIVTKLPPPKNKYIEKDNSEYFKALLIDSWYDTYLGIIVLLRIFQGSIKEGEKIKFLSTQNKYNVDKVGIFTPEKKYCSNLNEGEIGFLVAGIKNAAECQVGDTIINANHDDEISALPGFKPIQHVVFCGLFPVDVADFEYLETALNKLKLNDSSIVFEVENSSALGLGFRCGFLGLLHLEIVQERLSREFEIDMIATAPSVMYKIFLNNGKQINIHNAADFPDKTQITEIQEPWVSATMLLPSEYLGKVLTLCTEKRGIQIEMDYISEMRVMLKYKLPLNEIIFDFYDKLKSCTRGYASVDWELDQYEEGDLVKLNILVNGEVVDALSIILHKSKAERRGREMCNKLKDLIPRQLFQIPIQAAIGGKIIARENVKAMRKDVLAKCYGGDVSRKRKLLEKQKKGKKRMSTIGNVEIPQSAFIETLKISDSQ